MIALNPMVRCAEKDTMRMRYVSAGPLFAVLGALLAITAITFVAEPLSSSTVRDAAEPSDASALVVPVTKPKAKATATPSKATATPKRKATVKPKPNATKKAEAKPKAKPKAKPGRNPSNPRPPAFRGAKPEPLDEMPLPDRARLLRIWLRSHDSPTGPNVRYWRYQHSWIITGAQFGWWHGAQALEELVLVDRRVRASWGIGARSEAIARAALADVRRKSRRASGRR